MNFDNLFNQLQIHINGIKITYLDKHLINPLATPNDYDFDIKAFCILCHAAFEEYVESVALNVMRVSIEEYTQRSRITKPLVSLMHFKGSHDNYLQKLADSAKIDIVETIYDYNRKKLEDIKSSFSNEIYGNHGVSLKYLVNLLLPVSIDIPKNPSWANSLDTLANERGAYAHKTFEKGRFKMSIEPEKAKDIISDCLALCGSIRDKAKTALS